MRLFTSVLCLWVCVQQCTIEKQDSLIIVDTNSKKRFIDNCTFSLTGLHIVLKLTHHRLMRWLSLFNMLWNWIIKIISVLCLMHMHNLFSLLCLLCRSVCWPTWILVCSACFTNPTWWLSQLIDLKLLPTV